MKYLPVFLTFILIATHEISTAKSFSNHTVVGVESLELCPAELYDLKQEEFGCAKFTFNPLKISGRCMWNQADCISASSTATPNHFYQPMFQNIYAHIMGFNGPEFNCAFLAHEWEVSHWDNTCRREFGTLILVGDILVLGASGVLSTLRKILIPF